MGEMMVTGFKVDGFAPQEVSVLTLPARPFRVLLSKNPRDFVTVPKLLELDAEQWFIYMMRDPRDMVVSKHGRAPDRYWGNLAQWRNAWRTVAPFQAHPRLKIVRYEELVRDPNGIQAALAQFLPFLEKRGDFSDFHQRSRPSAQALRAMRTLRPVSDENVGNWRRHKERVVGQIREHGSLAQELIETGYEPDESWLRELEGIEPDLSPSFWTAAGDDEYVERQRTYLADNLPRYLRARGLATPQ
jgi:hypothetical protein